MSDEIETNLDCELCQRIFMDDVVWINRSMGMAVLRPENPVVEGHVYVVPINHSSNPMVDPDEFGTTMMFAAALAKSNQLQANFMSAAGQEADQGIFHTHVHLIPREPDDKIVMPWVKKSKLTWENS